MTSTSSEASGSRPAERRPTTAASRRSSTLAFYEVNCESYADATISLDTSNAIARFAARVTPRGTVLDAGCGSGRDLLRLQAAGLSPIGLDISPKLVEIARRNSGLPVVEGDLRSPPFPNGSFDGIWAMASLLHVELRDIGETIAGLTALLRPAGILFTSVKRGRGRRQDADGRWFTLHEEASWITLLEQAGLKILEVTCDDSRTIGTGTLRTGWISSLAQAT